MFMRMSSLYRWNSRFLNWWRRLHGPFFLLIVSVFLTSASHKLDDVLQFYRHISITLWDIGDPRNVRIGVMVCYLPLVVERNWDCLNLITDKWTITSSVESTQPYCSLWILVILLSDPCPLMCPAILDLLWVIPNLIQIFVSMAYTSPNSTLRPE